MHRDNLASSFSGFPSWSQDGLAARDIFFDSFNDVNFYVEDIDQENLYHLILSRLFPEIKISQIFPLGGKAPVINHAMDPVNQPNAHRSIYIVDKDFDDLLGHVIQRDNLFYLSKYCIENFLLEEAAVIEVAVEAQPKTSRQVHARTLLFSEYMRETIEKVTPLFKLFFVVQRLNLGLKNCDLKPESFSIKNHPEIIDTVLIKSYEIEVRKAAEQTNLFKSEDEFIEFVSNAFPPSISNDINICGKFLLALTMHYMKSKLKFGNISFESLTYRLANHSRLLDLNPLKTSIDNYLRRFKAN